MTDVLIRNVAEDDLRLLDHRAERLGVSRTEYLRTLLSDAARAESSQIRMDISVTDFAVLADLPDAADEDFIRDAWSRDR